MEAINLADAKAHLSELVSRVEAGDTIHISRRGKPIAQITQVPGQRKPIDIAALRALTDSMPASSADNIVRAMRDQARY